MGDHDSYSDSCRPSGLPNTASTREGRLDDDRPVSGRRALIAPFAGFNALFDRLVPHYNSFLNSSIVRPASRTMPPIVNALTGLARGIVRMRRPSDMTTCLPSRTTLKPAFSKARIAWRCGTPGAWALHHYLNLPDVSALGLLPDDR